MKNKKRELPQHEAEAERPAAKRAKIEEESGPHSEDEDRQGHEDRRTHAQSQNEGERAPREGYLMRPVPANKNAAKKKARRDTTSDEQNFCAASKRLSRKPKEQSSDKCDASAPRLIGPANATLSTPRRAASCG